MANIFSDFMNTSITEDCYSNKAFDETKNNENINISYENRENIENLVNKYSNFSSDELMQEFLKITENKRRNGTLNNDLDRMKTTLSPFLNDEQINKMNDIINKVK